jgi:hypothetical protein
VNTRVCGFGFENGQVKNIPLKGKSRIGR